MPEIRRLLVANRGEIARRVMRTAREMGIATVAVYSDVDATAPHVDDADVAVPLGGTTSRESYLDAGKILDAVSRTGADAVHPGYGFLSENAEFAEACATAGVVFVGPSPTSIRNMGLKDRAKEIARSAGVPVLPDHVITGADHDEWRAAADRVGYPLLVKATAGGGGKGMRRVESATELVDAVDGARREASNSFGNSDVFLERYLSAARHIEVQVFGDHHGGAVHLGERECSIQRRHQKVLEEAPSPVVDTDLRTRMGATAVALVKELGYVGAGTVEFLFDDATGEFFFLEMNTRLQVEHPVTEEVTGMDLVRLQLEVAQERPLRFSQDDVRLDGHAIEVRLYAEDPAHDYLPTPGVLHRYTHELASARVRFEDGVGAHGEVSAFYDPMIAKVVASAPTRRQAAAILASGLDAIEVHGVVTNRDFLRALLQAPDFLAGNTHTDFLDHHRSLLDPELGDPAWVHLAAAIATTVASRRALDTVTGFAPPGFRILHGDGSTRATWHRVGAADLDVAYRLQVGTGNSVLHLTVDGVEREAVVRRSGNGVVRVVADGVDYACRIVTHSDGSVWVNTPRAQTGWREEPRLGAAGADSAAAGSARAQLPGTVVAVLVAPGDRVESGQKLIVVEAMKMEHPANAAEAGIVEAVHVAVGDFVDADAALVTVVGGDAE
ncbi:biotin carboxylase N-terminal domain-containing protein [Mycobacterium syngnathidarum]